jgi:hypothetical protein
MTLILHWNESLHQTRHATDELTGVYLAKRLAFTGLGLGFTDLKAATSTSGRWVGTWRAGRWNA